jgi:hypothetical protein
VAILLSTFNGERYLAELLTSLTVQTHTDWRLYWRDDGSSDGTAAMMAGFAAEPATAERCTVCPQDGRLRATGSFLALLRLALRGSAAFFAFADQDDVWLPDKLAHAVAALGAVPADRPALYFCGRALVDATLAPIGQVLAPHRPPGFPAALTQNLAPGCCIMLNRAAAALIDSTAAPDGTWHDWWSYIVVSACGGVVIAGDMPDILYRQHSGNLVGEPRGFRRRALAAIRRGQGPFMTVFWSHVEELQSGKIPLPAETRSQLTIIERGKRGGLPARLKALRLPGFVRQTWAETLLFRLWFLLG